MEGIIDEYRPVTQTTNPTNSQQLTTNGVCKKYIHGKCLNKNCPNPHNKSKIKPCNNFEAHGKCQYGEKCNFSHQTRVCSFFMKGICQKGQHCPCKHVYKSCPNFDMGFCSQGSICKLKHITRRLCWDYMYGFCEKGSRCDMYHPKIFQPNDFKFTEKVMMATTGRSLLKYVCMTCGITGHKVTTCPRRREIEPTSIFKCGLCGSLHTYEEDCNNHA